MSLLSNLVSYWKLDESSGNAADSIGSNTLTNANTTPFVTGKINNGADLERGSSQYFSISDASQSGLDGMSALSISLWVKFESVTTLVREPLVSKWNPANTGWMFLKDDSNILLLAIGDGVTPTFDSVAWTPSSGTWYHLVVTYDAGTIKFYVNGSQQGADQSSSYTTIPNTAGSFNLGRREDSAEYLDGILDEVGIWNRALTASEVTRLYNSGNALALSSFVVINTLDATVTTFALTTVNTILSRIYNLVASVTAFTVTGQNSILSRIYNMVATVTNYIVTGQDAILSVVRQFIREGLPTNSFTKSDLPTNSSTKEPLSTNSFNKEPLDYP